MSDGVRAVVMSAPGELGVERFPLPDPEPGAAVLRVRYSGICGTDKHTFRGETEQYAGTPHARTIGYPLICGHENVGTIAAMGGDSVPDSEGRPLREGDRVVPAANVACGECYFCRAGHPYYLCERLEDYGNSLGSADPPHLFGGWSEYLYLLPGTQLFRVPDELPDEVAVLTEPMAATHGFETARSLHGVAEGERVAVLGVGPLGICHLIRARLSDAGEIVAIDRLASRLELAGELGATVTLDASELGPEEIVAEVRRHSEGRGPDVVLDCSGFPETFVTSLRMVRTGGVVVEAGAFVDLGDVPVNPAADICAKNVAVLGIGGEMATAYRPTMELLSTNLERLPLERVVTHKVPLEEARGALELSESDAAMKVVFSPEQRPI